MSAENAVQQYIRENGQRFVEELSELLILAGALAVC